MQQIAVLALAFLITPKGHGAHLAIFLCPETRQVPKCSIFYALSYAFKVKKIDREKVHFWQP
jgi:hypothetical protein